MLLRAALLLCLTLADGDDIDGVRAYLAAVYPAASLRDADDATCRALFESLDYFYACDDARAAAMRPPAACAPLSARFAPPAAPPRRAAPPLPYLPAGPYFSADEQAQMSQTHLEATLL